MNPKLQSSIFKVYLNTWYSLLNPGGKKVKLAGNRVIKKEIANQARDTYYLITMTESEFSLN